MTISKDLLTPRRGRPTAERAEAIDRHVVDVARAMFLEDGYDNVAMEQVATAAQISKGTLYARHPSKESLFAAVVEAAIAQWSAESASHDHLLTDDIEQRLRYHVDSLIASLRRPDVLAFQRLVLSVRDRFPDAGRAMYESGYRYLVDFISRDIAEAGERDGMPARNPSVVAELLVAAITGREIQEGQADEALERFGHGIVDLLIAGRRNW